MLFNIFFLNEPDCIDLSDAIRIPVQMFNQLFKKTNQPTKPKRKKKHNAGKMSSI